MQTKTLGGVSYATNPLTTTRRYNGSGMLESTTLTGSGLCTPTVTR